VDVAVDKRFFGRPGYRHLNELEQDLEGVRCEPDQRASRDLPGSRRSSAEPRLEDEAAADFRTEPLLVAPSA
jgi:hypothetical protein